MRTAIVAVLVFGVLAIASGFLHHPHHHHDDSDEQMKKDMEAAHEETATESHQEHHHHHHHNKSGSGDEGQGEHHHHHHHHNESGSGDEGHHHHHHHKHHHKKHHHHHHHHHHDWKCNGETIKKNDEFINAKKECDKEFQDAKTNDVEGRQKGKICKSICSGTKMGFFDSEGQIVQSKLDDLIESIIPGEENQTQIKKKAAECAHKHSASLEDGPSDEKCSNYKPYLECIVASTMQVCKPKVEETKN